MRETSIKGIDAAVVASLEATTKDLPLERVMRRGSVATEAVAVVVDMASTIRI